MRTVAVLGGGEFSAFAADATFAYFKVGSQLLVVDVATNPARPTQVGALELGITDTNPVGSIVSNHDTAARLGDYLYVVVPYGLLVVDVSNPTRPIQVGGLDLPGARRLAIGDG